MSTTIDERVVEMRFDNASFEKNAATSISTLDKLKKSLKLKGAGDGFEKVEKAARKVELSPLEKSVANLEKRFSTLGIVGMRVIENLTDSMMNYGRKALNFITEGVVQGGIRRATNIEHAHFQLQGLLKDEEKVQAVMDDAMQSVDGTAYAFDAAAKAASMFAASGLEAGDQMRQALRGITGVAAMTNSEYESISEIFTTVAGQGKITAMQLNQLANRGMNGAATIAEFFNKVNSGTANTTEEAKKAVQSITKSTSVAESDIREMVRKSKISFEIFSAAMDDAFGEHAKKANETFDGALSNIKAALARIGADFVSPLIEQNGPLVEVLNRFREKVNDVKNELTWDAEKASLKALQDSFHMAKWQAEEFYKVAHEAGDVVSIDQLERISDVDAGKSRKVIAEYIKGVDEHTRVASQSVKEAIKTLQDTKAARIINNILNGSDRKPRDPLILGALKNITKGAELTGESLRELVDNGKINLDWFGDELVLTEQNIGDFAREGKLSLELFDEAIADTFGEKTLVKKFTDAVTLALERLNEWLETADGSRFGRSIAGFFEGLWNILSAIGRIIGPIAAAFKDVFFSGAAENAKTFGEAFRDLTEHLKISDEAAEKLRSTFKGLFAIFDIVFQVIKAVVTGLFPGLAEGIKGISGGILEATGSWGEMMYAFDQMLKKTDVFKNISKIISNGMIVIKSKVTDAAYAIREFFTGIRKDGSSDGLTFFERLKERLSALGQNIKEFVQNSKVLQGIANFFKGVFEKIKQALQPLIDKFKDFKMEFDGEKLKKALVTGGIVGVLAFVAKKIYNFYWKMKNGIGGILNLFGGVKKGGLIGTLLFGESFGNILQNISNALNAFTSNIRADTLGKIAKAILILAGALFLMTKIDSDKLGPVIGAMITMFAGLSGLLLIIMKIMKTMNKTDAATKKFGWLSPSKGGKGSFIDRIKNGITGIIGSVKDALQTSIIINAIGDVIIKIGAAIFIIAAAIKMLGKMNPDQIKQGGIAVTAIFAAIAGFLIVMELINKKVKSVNTDKTRSTLERAALSIVAMGFAFRLIAKAIADLGKLNQRELTRGVIAFMVVSTFLTLLTGIAGAAKFEWKQGGGILLMAMALMKVFKVVEKFGEMDWGKMIKGLAGAGMAAGLLIGIIALMSRIAKSAEKVNGKKYLAMSGTMLMLAAAIDIMAPAIFLLSMLPWQKALVGGILLGGIIAVICVAFSQLDKYKDSVLRSATSLMIVAAAFLVLTPALIALGIGALPAAMGVGVMTLALFAFAGVCAFIEHMHCADVMLKVGIAVGIMGAGMALITLAVLMFVHSLIELGREGPIAIAGILASMALFMQGMIAMAPLMEQFFYTMLLTGIKVITNLIPALVEALVTMVIKSVQSFSQHAGEIVDYIMVGIMKILDVLIARTPQLITKVFEFLAAIWHGVTQALEKVDGNAVLNGIKVILLVSAFMFEMAALAVVAPLAAVGLLAFGGLITELAHILNKLGELEGYLPNIEKAQAVLEAIGNAIGSFIGGIIGGILEGITDSLPKVGENLSVFMANMEPFLEGCKKIGNEQADYEKGINALCRMLLILGGAELMDAVAGWISGGNVNMDKFMTQITGLGPALRSFYDSLGDIDANATANAAQAGRDLAEMLNMLPKEGGIKDFFTGTTDFEKFGSMLVPFGKCIKEFGETVRHVRTESINRSVEAARGIVAVANEIPNSGGAAGFFAGNNDMADFGPGMVSFGNALRDYGNAVRHVRVDSITRSNEAARGIIEVAKEIPNTGGVAGFFAGNNDFAEFAPGMIQFAKALHEYGKAVQHVRVDSISRSVPAAEQIIAIAEKIPSTGGAKGFFEGKVDLAEFASGMLEFAQGLLDYSNAVAGIDIGSSGNAKIVADRLLDSAERMNNVNFLKWDEFNNRAKKYGEALAGYYNAIAGITDFDSNAINHANYIATSITSVMQTLTDMGTQTGGIKGAIFGNVDLSSFSDSIAAFGGAIQAFATNTVGIDGKTIQQAWCARQVGQTVIALMGEMPESGGIRDLMNGTMNITDFSTQMGYLGSALSSYSQNVKEVDTTAVTNSKKAAETIFSLFNNNSDIDFAAISQTGFGAGNLGEFAKQLITFGENLVIYGQKVEGMDTDSIVNSKEGVQTIFDLLGSFQATEGWETFISGNTKISTIGDQFAKFGEKLKSYADSVHEIDMTDLRKIPANVSRLFKIAKEAVDVNADALVNFTKTLSQVNKTGVNDFIEAFANANKAVDAIKAFMASMNTAVEGENQNFSSLGTKLVNYIVTAIKTELSSDRVIEDFKMQSAAIATVIIVALNAGINRDIGGFTYNLLTQFDNQINNSSTAVMNKFKAVGEYIVAGIKVGISNNWIAFESYWTGLMQSLLEKTRDEMGIQSPSKEFKYIAKMMIEGLIVGITQNQKRVEKTMKIAVKALVKDAKSMGLEIMEVIKTTTGAIEEYLKVFESVRDYAKGVVSSYKELYGSHAVRALEKLASFAYRQTDAFKTAKQQIKEYKKEIDDIKSGKIKVEIERTIEEENEDGTKTKKEKSAEELAKEQAEANEKRIQELNNNIKETTKQMAKDRKQAMQDFINDIKSTVKQAANIFEEFSTGTYISPTQQLERAKKTIEGMYNWEEVFTKLVQKGAPIKMLQELLAKGPSGIAEMNALLQQTPENFRKIIESWNLGRELGKTMSKEFIAAMAWAIDNFGSKSDKKIDEAIDRLTKKLGKKGLTKKQKKAIKEKISGLEELKKIREDASEEYAVSNTVFSVEEIAENREKTEDALRQSFVEPTKDTVKQLSDLLAVDTGLFTGFVNATAPLRDGFIAPLELATQALDAFGLEMVKDTEEYIDLQKQIDLLIEYLGQDGLTKEQKEDAQKTLSDLYKQQTALQRKAANDWFKNLKSNLKNSLNLLDITLDKSADLLDFTSKKTIETLKDDSKEIVDIFSVTAQDSIDAFSKIEKASSISKRSLLKIMKNNLKTYSDYQSNLAKLRSTTRISDEAFAAISDMGLSGAGYIKALLKMTPEEIAEVNESFAKTGRVNAENYLKAVKDNLTRADQRTKDLQTLFNNGLSKDAYDYLVEQGESAEDVITNLLKLTRSEIQQINQLYSKANDSNAAEVIIDNMQSVIDAYEDWRSDWAKLQKRSLPDDIMEKLADMGLDGAKYVKAFANMTNAELEKSIELFRKQSDLQEANVKEQAQKKIAAAKEWAAKIIDLSGIEGISNAMLRELVAAGPGNTDYIDALLEMNKEGTLASFSATYDEIDNLVETLAESISKAIGKAFGDVKDEASTDGEQVGDEFGTGETEGAGAAAEGAEAITDASKEKLEEGTAEEEVKPYGEQVMDGLAAGEESGLPKVLKTTSEVCARIKKRIESKLPKSDFILVGQHIVGGMKKGINDNAYKAINAAEELAKSIKKTIKKAYDINSPSKWAIGIGRNLNEGTAIGLTNFAYMAINAAQNMSDDVKEGISEVFTDDMEFAPRIAPSIDMEDVNNKADAINMMLGLDKLDANVTLETRNKDIVDAVKEMRQDFSSEINRLSDSIHQMQIVMDTGQLVGAMAAPMDAEMGRRFIYQQRGMM